MKIFWKENKWYILSVVATLLLAMMYLWLSDNTNNLLPEVYSVM